MNSVWSRTLSGLALTTIVGLAACGDSTGPEVVPPEQVAVVVNSVDNSLTVFPVADPAASITIGLGGDGTPVGAAVAGNIVVVPLGLTPAVAVVDLGTGSVRHTIALPQGSGATGVALVGTEMALATNPQLNTVSVLDLVVGTRVAEIPVGQHPAVAVADEEFAYVLNRWLGPDFQPAGPGTVSVIELSTLEVVATISLTGTNPGAAVLDGNRLYVLHAGTWDGNDGSLSIVDSWARTEMEHVTGFGNFPGSLTRGPDGRLYTASFSYGVAIWDPGTGAFARSPDDAVQPGGMTAVSDVGFDQEGRLYAPRPFCSPGEPDLVFRLGTGFEVDTEIAVGNCPTAILFTATG